jgi:hypothetical protein
MKPTPEGRMDREAVIQEGLRHGIQWSRAELDVVAALLAEVRAEEREQLALKDEQIENMVKALLIVLDKLGKDHPLHAEMCAALFVPDPQPPPTPAEVEWASTIAAAAIRAQGESDGA